MAIFRQNVPNTLNGSEAATDLTPTRPDLTPETITRPDIVCWSGRLPNTSVNKVLPLNINYSEPWPCNILRADGGYLLDDAAPLWVYSAAGLTSTCH